MLSSAHQHGPLGGRQDTPENLRHELEAIQLMKETLSDPTKSTSDEMIQTAVYIASNELCPLDLVSREVPSLGLNRRVIPH